MVHSKTFFSVMAHSKPLPLRLIPNSLLCYGPFKTFALEAHSKLSSSLWHIPNFLFLFGLLQTLFLFKVYSKLSSLLGPFQTFYSFKAHSKSSSPLWPIPNSVITPVHINTFLCPFVEYYLGYGVWLLFTISRIFLVSRTIK